jgi:hypothetical protein
MKIDETALTEAAKKLRRLKLETVYGRKERPAETVASVMDRAWNGTGSVEAQEYILRHGLKYYFAALEKVK